MKNLFFCGLILLAFGLPSVQAQSQATLILGQGAILGAGWLSDESIWVWSETGLRLYTLDLEEIAFIELKNLRLLAWKPDGTHFLAQSQDLSLTLWAYAEGRAQKVWFAALPDPLTDAAWQGEQLALSFENKIQIWESPTLLEGHQAPITALAWGGRYLASADTSGRVILWENGARIQEIQAHEGAITALSWQNADILATGSQTGEIKIWEGASARLTQTLGNGTAPINALDWQGNYLVSAAGFNFEGSEVRVWFARTGETVRLFGAHAAMTISAWNPAGDVLLAAGKDNLLRLWDAEGNPLGTLTGYMDAVEAVAWSPDGAELASAHDDGLIRIWDSQTGALNGILQGHTRGVNAIQWSDDGLLLASAGWDNTVRVWVRQTGKTRSIFREHTQRVWAVAWHGRLIASASRDETLRIWNALTGETLHILRGANSDLLDLAWSPDGAFISASSDDGNSFIWDTQTGELLHQLSGQKRYTFSMDWSPLQNQIISGSWYDGSLRFWDSQTGARLRDFNSARVYSLDWHPAGQLLVTGDDKGVIRVWNLEAGQVTRSLDKHQGIVYDLAWSPDGERLASAGADGRLIIWDR